MEYNYIVAYRSGINYYPISIFVNHEEQINDFHPVTCEEDLVNIVLGYCDPLDDAVVCKKTLLDYDAYCEDRYNITNGLLAILDEQD